jgi:hypothetical protein
MAAFVALMIQNETCYESELRRALSGVPWLSIMA